MTVKRRWILIGMTLIGLAALLIVWQTRADIHHQQLNVALSRALERGTEADIPIVKDLIHKGADPNTSENYEPTHESIFVRLKRMLLRHPAPQKRHGKTVLMFASAYKDLDLVRELLQRGADVNMKSKNDETALLLAVMDAEYFFHFENLSKTKATPASSGEIVRLLLNAKADPNVDLGWPGGTPYTMSMNLMDDAVDQEFLRHGAKWNIKNRFGTTGLTIAVELGRTALVRRMLMEGANPNEAESRHGETVLMRAVSDNHVEVARMLLDAGAKVNTPFDMAGTNPLNWAIEKKGSVEMVKVLLDRGADPNLKVGDGKTAWDRARELPNKPVLKMLESHAKKQAANHGKP